jgi:hypothetical protein
MKKTVVVLLSCFACTVIAQTQLNQQANPSVPGYPAIGGTNASQGLSQNLMITNPAGGTFQIGELDAQLASLKADVQRTLPMVSAVVSHGAAPNTATSTTAQLANEAGSLIANAFHHGTNVNNSLPPSGASPRSTNFAGFLQSLLSTNTAGAGGVTFDPNTVSQLATLQTDLQQALAVLNNLNVASTGGLTNEVPGTYRGLTPTGR